MAKRLNERMVREWDNHHRTSYHREIEMLLDAVSCNAGYKLQFWKDALVYSFYEATIYLADFTKDVTNLEALREGIRQIEAKVLHVSV